MADTDPRAQAFAQALNSYLSRVGWNNEKERDRFKSVILTFITNANTTGSQVSLNNFLERGLDILRIQIKKDSMAGEEVDTVTTATDDDGNEVVTEAKKIIKEKQKILNLTESLFKHIKTKMPQHSDTIVAGIHEAIKKSTNRKEDVVKIYNKILSENLNENRGRANENNFRIFMRNHMVQAGNWDEEKISEVINSFLNIVNNLGGNIDLQNRMLVTLDRFYSRHQSKFSPSSDETSSNNFRTALDELSFYAVNFRGWSTDNSSKLRSFIQNTLTGKIDSQTQRALITYLGRVSNVANTQNKGK